jgi:hypothetical protein
VYRWLSGRLHIRFSLLACWEIPNQMEDRQVRLVRPYREDCTGEIGDSTEIVGGKST